ncbi:MAG: biotin/lipoyl-binding protein, partial [Prevotella sp.]|nr:biotin/lipoyl-binding protein [Prevotella sp.]
MNKRRIWIPVCLLAGLLLAGGIYYSLMDDEDDEEFDEEYRTLTMKSQDYTVTREFTAKIETENPAVIRPQVSGKITKICVKEGARVKKGQPL